MGEQTLNFKGAIPNEVQGRVISCLEHQNQHIISKFLYCFILHKQSKFIIRTQKKVFSRRFFRKEPFSSDNSSFILGFMTKHINSINLKV